MRVAVMALVALTGCVETVERPTESAAVRRETAIWEIFEMRQAEAPARREAQRSDMAARRAELAANVDAARASQVDWERRDLERQCELDRGERMQREAERRALAERFELVRAWRMANCVSVDHAKPVIVESQDSRGEFHRREVLSGEIEVKCKADPNMPPEAKPGYVWPTPARRPVAETRKNAKCAALDEVAQ